ncbi:hypothetical protein LR69_01278 [Geobacillus sp. BCO2]|nr:hypothetical protein LR69_01278 [Geobacillus sp. BCO2]
MTGDRIQDWIGMCRVPVYTATVVLYVVARFVETAPFTMLWELQRCRRLLCPRFFARGVYQVSGALVFCIWCWIVFVLWRCMADVCPAF